MILLSELVFPEAYADFADHVLPIPDDYPLQEGLTDSFRNDFKRLLNWRGKYTGIWLRSRKNFAMCRAS
jgi:hypothetical protein